MLRRTARALVRVGTVIAAVAMMCAGVLVVAPTASAGAAEPQPNGYFLLGDDGGIFPFGVPFAGAPATDPTRCATDACTSIAVTPSGLGYWVLDNRTGAVYAFGTAGFYGDPATVFAHSAVPLIPRTMQIVGTPDGKGYWIYETISGLGRVEPFGDAGWFTDTFSHYPWGTGHPHFNGFPVGMAATPSGKGYWEVWSDGGVFAYGDAKFYGSTGNLQLTKPIIGMTATVDGKGYWLYAGDGGVFSFGDAVFGGSAGALPLVSPIVGMTRNPSGPGYWLAGADGGVFAYGGAPYLGTIAQFGVHLNRPIAAIAARSAAIT